MTLKAYWHRHRVLIAILGALSVVAGTSQFLRADLVGGPSESDTLSLSADEDEFRVCSSAGTVFEEMVSLTAVMEKFQQGMSAVTGEREQFLALPSRWQCISGSDGQSDPAFPALQELAENMPGWFDKTPDGSRRQRNVTFDSFASIVAEFLREYECKLSEFQEDAFRIVYADTDLPEPTGREPAQVDFALRTPSFWSLQQIERQRARTAVNRTLQALRSFEVSYTYAKPLTCFQRASHDLKNELSLLADAISSMPKIWDALTSLHDPKTTFSSAHWHSLCSSYHK